MSLVNEKPRPIQRRFNVLLFGEPGAGKSSVISLIADRDVAKPFVSHHPFDAWSCKVTIQGRDFRLFDTVGLIDPLSLRDPSCLISAIGKAHHLVKYLSETGGINLLVFCKRRGRVTTNVPPNYLLFHDFLCDKKVPVALVITHSEREENMENWWLNNYFRFTECGIDVAGHACITTKREFGDQYHASKQTIHDLIVAHGCGAGFMQERVGWITRLFKKLLDYLGFRPLFDSLRFEARRLREYGLSDDEIFALLENICIIRNNRLGPLHPFRSNLLHAKNTPTVTAAGDIVANPTTPTNLDEALQINNRESFPNDLTGRVIREGRDPVASGGFADIHKGVLQQRMGRILVAIKAIKTYSAEDGDFVKKRRRLRREIKVWLGLKHNNVLPLLGTTDGYGRFPAMVSPWAENGSLTSYLESRRELPVADLLRLLINVACGLRYLHLHSVVHGDLSGSNILICKKGNACITDFGLSTLLTEIGGSTFATSFHARGTIRWMAPELLDLREPEDDLEEVQHVFPTTHSDVYSFGGIMLQILSGKVPYHYYARDLQVVRAVTTGVSPVRPNCASITESRWAFIQRCWSTVDITQTRPSSDEIVDFTMSELADISAS